MSHFPFHVFQSSMHPTEDVLPVDSVRKTKRTFAGSRSLNLSKAVSGHVFQPLGRPTISMFLSARNARPPHWDTEYSISEENQMKIPIISRFSRRDHSYKPAGLETHADGAGSRSADAVAGRCLLAVWPHAARKCGDVCPIRVDGLPAIASALHDHDAPDSAASYVHG